MVASSNNFEDFELMVKGFEAQRGMGRLKSANMEIERDEFSRFLVTEKLSDGWDEVGEEHIQIDMEPALH